MRILFIRHFQVLFRFKHCDPLLLLLWPTIVEIKYKFNVVLTVHRP